jgi:hypothetical protein
VRRRECLVRSIPAKKRFIRISLSNRQYPFCVPNQGHKRYVFTQPRQDQPEFLHLAEKYSDTKLILCITCVEAVQVRPSYKCPTPSHIIQCRGSGWIRCSVANVALCQLQNFPLEIYSHSFYPCDISHALGSVGFFFIDVLR